VDFEELRASDDRVTQRLVTAAESSGCTLTLIRTPAGGGSPAGLHTHEVDQVFYVLEGR